MSTKLYSYICVVFAVSASIIWLANVFTMFAGVVFGFIAFGLVFTGMMCVLPATAAHPSSRSLHIPLPQIQLDPAMRPVEVRPESVRFPMGLRIH